MRYGLIGYGSMGSAVTLALLGDGSLREQDIVVYNRTPARLEGLKRDHPGVAIASSPAEAARKADAVFVCVHSHSVPEVVDEIREALTANTHLLVLNGGVRIDDLARYHDGPISKVIPSITLATGRGIILMTHGAAVPVERARSLEALFSRSSRVMVVPEEQLEAATDLTSCGPGLLAEMMAEFARTGARAGGLEFREAMDMVAETMLGTALMLAGGTTPSELKCRVATRGGITEQGIAVLENELPPTFERMFEATRRKRETVRASLDSEPGRGR
ncbi:MAG: NAD(P)-binding domain-containing protein [Methanomassiliicoccus sp.]|nr:NAD(P)-binding domain-containing protein [Methanomassiliicoccus sp.]